MNILGIASPGKGELWAWTATDKTGRVTKYQSHGPDVSESSMLAHINRHYPGLTVTDLKRITIKEYVPANPALGGVEEHAFMCGAREGFRNDFAKMAPGERGKLIEQAMNLKPMQLDKWGTIPDPMTNAVADAVYAMDAAKKLEQQNKPRSIREKYSSVRNLIRS